MTDTEMMGLYEAGSSIHQIAILVGRPYNYVRRHLLKVGARMRSVGEGVSLAVRQPPLEVTTKLRELTDGLLLGDGYIKRSGVGSSLRLIQAEMHSGWVRQVLAFCEKAGMKWGECSVPRGEVVIRGKMCHRQPAWGFASANYSFFTEQRDRWYPDGYKHVPEDVLLTPFSIAHWYFGDGGVGCKGYHANFSTDGFPAEEVAFLISRLSAEYGWRPTHDRRNRIVLTFMEDRAALRKMIEPFTPECFRYKLDLKVTFERRRIGPKEQEELLRLRGEGWSYGALAARFGVPRSDIAVRCKAAGLGGARCRPGPEQKSRVCEVPGCGRKHTARGMCAYHYLLAWKKEKC